MAIDYGEAIGNLGRVFGGAAAGSATQRANEAPAAISADQLQRRSQILASLLGGLNDASVTSPNPNIAARTPTVTGGLRPSAMFGSAGAGQGPMDGRRGALIGMLNTPVDIPKAGTGEKVMGGLGMGASVLGALWPILSKLLGGGASDDPDQQSKGPSEPEIPVARIPTPITSAVPTIAQPRPNVEVTESPVRLPEQAGGGGGGREIPLPEADFSEYDAKINAQNPNVTTSETTRTRIRVGENQEVEVTVLPGQGPGGQDLAADDEGRLYVNVDGNWFPL